MMSVSITRSSSHTMQVSASFESTDPTGAIVTDVGVNAAETYQTINGKTTFSSPTLDISLSVGNEAGGFFITVGESEGPATKLVIDPNLQSAHLVGDVIITDLNDVVYDVHADVTWNATDAVQTESSKTFSFESPGVAELLTNSGSGDDAVAAGIVSIPATVSFSAIHNAIPVPSNQAVIQKVTNGTTTITVTIPPKWKFFFPSFGTKSILLDATDALSKLTGM